MRPDANLTLGQHSNLIESMGLAGKWSHYRQMGKVQPFAACYTSYLYFFFWQMHAWINILLEHMCREVMRSGLGPFCYVHSEFSRLKLALARCFTCLFIVNVNAQLNFEARNGNDVCIDHAHPSCPFHKKGKIWSAANNLKWCWSEFQFLTERKTFLPPTAGRHFGQKPFCLLADVWTRIHKRRGEIIRRGGKSGGGAWLFGHNASSHSSTRLGL